MTWGIFSSAKSGKREIAVSLLSFWVIITGYLFFYIPDPVFKSYENGWETLTLATFGFAAGAFGIDFWMKAKAAMPAPQPQRRRRADVNPETIGGAV